MILENLKSPGLWFLVICSLVAFSVGKWAHPTWTADRVQLDLKQDNLNRLYYMAEGNKRIVRRSEIVPAEKSTLSPERLEEINKRKTSPILIKEFVSKQERLGNQTVTNYYLVTAHRHWGIWSLLPAFVALVLCWITKEPITALFSGIVIGALILGKYDITEAVLVPELSSKSAAGIIVLYLWLLGGLMGIWSRTGAAQAFADLMTKYFVRGPKSAKLVSWFLGVLFFQGGTVSTVLVGTTVKPIADKHRVSHEELSYVVDSTASPIASQLAFNAWPGYVQTFIYVGGVSWLATETDRIAFFFRSVPFCFYAIFAVLGTFLLSIERAPFLGKKMREAIIRARTTGLLDAPGAKPLSAKELQVSHIPKGYKPSVLEFFLPLGTLIAISIGTFVLYGVPIVRWAFGIALILAFSMALLRGMSVTDAVDGVASGLKGVVVGSVILLLAITIGSISKQVGGGVFLVELFKDTLPYWSLPVLLQILTIITAFSTGTSWGTYAIAFPLAMPLSYAIAVNQNLAHPEFFMTICFAAVMDGSVYGDQCSPISDTTVLSAMCTGCDLIDHVKTQLPQASAAALLAAIGWTACVLLFA